MTSITISDYQWQTFAQGDKVFARPVLTYATNVIHRYEALNIAPGLTIDGMDLELTFQVSHETKGWIDAVPNYKWHADLRNKYVIRLKTQAVDDKSVGQQMAQDYTGEVPRILFEIHSKSIDEKDLLWAKEKVQDYTIATIVQETLKYVAERGTVCHGTRIIDCEELPSLQPEIIKIIKEKKNHGLH